MIVIAGMFQGHAFEGGRPVAETNLIEGGVIVCPDPCLDWAYHHTYDGIVMPVQKLQVETVEEARRLKESWPAEWWERWQLGEDRLFYRREEVPE